MEEYITLAERLARGESKEDLMKELETQIDAATAELKKKEKEENIKKVKEDTQKVLRDYLISDLIEFCIAYDIIEDTEDISDEDYDDFSNLLDEVGKNLKSYISLLSLFDTNNTLSKVKFTF